MKPHNAPSSLSLVLACLCLFFLTACQSIPLEVISSPTVTAESTVQAEPTAQVEPTVRSQTEAIDALNENASSPAIVSNRRGTNEANFVRSEDGGDLLPDYKARTPEEKVAEFFKQFGDLFGIQDPSTELQLVDKQTDSLGIHSLTYQQFYEGVPVFGGQLRARVTTDNQLTSINGIFIVVESPIDPVPALQPNEAAEIALNFVQKQLDTQAAGSALLPTSTMLYIYQKGLAQGAEGPQHLVYEVEVTNSSGSIREFIYVEAHSGEVVDQVSGIMPIHRRVYDREISPFSLYWKDGDQTPVGNADIDNLINYSEDVYNLFLTMSGGKFRSWNGYDAIMHSVHNASDIGCANNLNAYWSGYFIAFCPDIVTDDIVAHEWAHAYTESTHGLVYSYQSGALNESYSDIFGEIVDLLNNAEEDMLDVPRIDSSCLTDSKGYPIPGKSQRWLLSEDAIDGVIRDMWNPTCFGHPGKVSDPEYHCGELDPRYGDNPDSYDEGGVHFNSGIPNHAFALLVDGGEYNGFSIEGIGLTKAAHIYWHAATNIQTQFTDFYAHADALQTACRELKNSEEILPALSTTTTVPFDSSEIISENDCVQVANVIDAVELRHEPTQCPAMLDPNAPPLCAANDTVNVLTSIDWESGAESWLTGTHSVSNTNAIKSFQWKIVDSLPDERPGHAMFVQNLNAICNEINYSGVFYLESPAIEIPEGVLQPRVAFTHWLASQYGLDGGNLKVSVNDGEWQLVPSEALVFNPYNAQLYSDEFSWLVNTNPLAGEPAFTGGSPDYDGGSWGQTHVNLYGLAEAGDTIRLRFEFGQDYCSGRWGWYVDEVQSYYCSSEIVGAMCGNGLLDIGEACDDGNNVSGDGCSQLCMEEHNWSCTAPIPPRDSTELVQDGSFELGASEGAWTFTFEDYDPLYQTMTSDDQPEPTDGTYYLWFGGVKEYESASVTQVITIPTTASILTFDLLINACDSADDYMHVLIDDTVVFTSDPCSLTSSFTNQEVDVTPFADGSAHTLQFKSEIFATNGRWSSFYVDRVSMSDNQPVAAKPSVCTLE